MKQKEEMVKRCHQVFGENHDDGTMCLCLLACSPGA